MVLEITSTLMVIYSVLQGNRRLPYVIPLRYVNIQLTTEYKRVFSVDLIIRRIWRSLELIYLILKISWKSIPNFNLL